MGLARHAQVSLKSAKAAPSESTMRCVDTEATSRLQMSASCACATSQGSFLANTDGHVMPFECPSSCGRVRAVPMLFIMLAVAWQFGNSANVILCQHALRCTDDTQMCRKHAHSSHLVSMPAHTPCSRWWGGNWRPLFIVEIILLIEAQFVARRAVSHRQSLKCPRCPQSSKT
eukprot:jgi/Ulvmu1/1579/UM111_0007.1